MLTFGLEGVDGVFAFADVDYAVNVERDLLAVGAPVLVAEAVGVFAVMEGGIGVVAVGDGALVDFVLAARVGDLSQLVSHAVLFKLYRKILSACARFLSALSMTWVSSSRQLERGSPRDLGAAACITYPEVNIEVACAAKLAIANLEGNSHLVILAEVLVEAFEAVGR